MDEHGLMSGSERRIQVDIGRQRLILFEGQRILEEFTVSTARNGPGERMGSECTPRGLHRIRIKIGAGCATNTVFVGRRPTGELCTPALRARHPGRDWILTRILWLTGTEPGRNRGGRVDSLRRYIYIHGCPADAPLGVPGSRGCIRMGNRDVIALFEQVDAGTPVDIRERSSQGI